jgi:hypothetical protein
MNMQVLSTPNHSENASPAPGVLRRDVVVGGLAAMAATMAAPALAANSLQTAGDHVSHELAILLHTWREIRAEKDAQGDVVDALDNDPERPSVNIALSDVIEPREFSSLGITGAIRSDSYTSERGQRMREMANTTSVFRNAEQNERRRAGILVCVDRLDALHAERSAAYEAWRLAVGYDDADAKLDALYGAMWEAEDEIANCPCHTAADAAAKALFLMELTEGDDGETYGPIMFKIMKSMLGLAPEQMRSA